MNLLNDIENLENDIKLLKDTLSKKYKGKEVKMKYRDKVRNGKIFAIIDSDGYHRQYLILIKFEGNQTATAYTESQFDEYFIE